jgi:hypothetical protein
MRSSGRDSPAFTRSVHAVPAAAAGRLAAGPDIDLPAVPARSCQAQQK